MNTQIPEDHAPLNSGESSSNTPIYRQLTGTLRAAIEAGDYPVGSTLPTEIEISQKFGVSRHTVRDALRILSEDGLIERRRRLGTVVTAKSQFIGFVQKLPGFEEILQAGRDVRLIADSYDVPLACPLAQKLNLDPKNWLRINGSRGPAERLLGLSTILIRRDYAPLKSELDDAEMSLDSLMEKSREIVIATIDLCISAITLDKEQARKFGVAEDASALQATRYYYGKKRTLLVATESIHPADRYSYTLSFSRDAAESL